MEPNDVVRNYLCKLTGYMGRDGTCVPLLQWKLKLELEGEKMCAILGINSAFSPYRVSLDLKPQDRQLPESRYNGATTDISPSSISTGRLGMDPCRTSFDGNRRTGGICTGMLIML